MNLRSRLAWTLGISVAAAVVVVSLVSVTAIDRALRTSLDARLRTSASAIAALVDVKNARLVLDSEDRDQMSNALGGAMDAAVFTCSGKTFVATSSTVPSSILAVSNRCERPAEMRDGGAGEHALRFASIPIERGSTVFGTAVVWRGSDFIDDFDRDAALAMGFAALLSGAAVIVFSSFLARRTLAPLSAFTELATEIEAHDLVRRVGRSGEDELGRLGSAFDRMLDRLEGAFSRQRRFTADASHELRAPLAVIRAEAEVALTRERAPDEYRRALQTIVSEVERIDALVDALLLAARADSARLTFERIDLGELVLLVRERFEPAAAARGLALDAQAGEAWIDADPAALDRALGAIVHNALDFAASKVLLRVGVTDGEVRLLVADDGPGFSEEGLRLATGRFWRDDMERRRGGTGLGLSIAEAIAKAHGGSLVLANGPSGGAYVTVILRSS
ncbi:MAG TPA: HAMP domain-containing sensor histidine kinase [Candidatus Baltobacteraceae bacterium]|nr:HAMP domain-containing sensor histidine kinase [Candidatus Baltobacteraceae bacterium]